ncbi:MAG: hypothetical protein HY763_05345 [Planctomycetes bacterium]|nr:hypothetical protein [Planctomycetota bacterium]
MLKLFIVYYKYQVAGEKKPGPVRQYRVYANSLEEARRLAGQQANYPNVEVLRVEARQSG